MGRPRARMLRESAVRLATIATWTLMATAVAVVYGVANDQLTVTLAPDYFSVVKRREFASLLERVALDDAPVRAQAVVIGAAGTWWFGMFLGAALSLCSGFGQAAPLTTRRFGEALAGVLFAALVLSVLAGGIAFVAFPCVSPERSRWIRQWGIDDVRSTYSVGWWHTGAYVGGLVGAAVACGWAQWRRTRA